MPIHQHAFTDNLLCSKISPRYCDSKKLTADHHAKILKPCQKKKKKSIRSAFCLYRASNFKKSSDTHRNNQIAAFNRAGMPTLWPNPQQRLKWVERVCQITWRLSLASGNLFQIFRRNLCPHRFLFSAVIFPFQNPLVRLSLFCMQPSG